MKRLSFKTQLFTLEKTLDMLLSILFNVTKMHSGVLILNRCKTAEYWAQESKKGWGNEYI